MTKFSILIPAYNCAAYLADAIASALAQSLAAVEVLVVDDGSTDGTAEVLQGFRNDARLRVLRQENKGLSAARNAALAAARGQYIGLLDADDRWHPDKAEQHLALFQAHPEVDLSYSWLRMIDENGHFTGRRQRPSLRRPRYEDLLCGNLAGAASTVVLRRDAVERAGCFDTSLRSYEDLDLWLRVAALRPGNVACLPMILTDYRVHSGQMTANLPQMRQAWQKVLEKARRQLPERVAAVEAVACARHTRYHAHLAYAGGQFSTARALLREAWAADPKSLFVDRKSVVTTAAVLASYLPGGLHDRLARLAKSILWRGAEN